MIAENAFNTIPYSTSRNNRVQNELMPEIIGLDQRSLASLIVEIRSIAKSIPFLDEAGDTLGSWQEFLDEDVLFFLIQLQQFSTQKIHQQIKDSTDEELESTFIYLIKTIDHWYRKANTLKIESLSFELENAIENRLKKQIIHLDKSKLSSLNRIWKTSSKEEVIYPLNFKEEVEVFLDTILFLQGISKTLFETYAKKEEISKPHIALIISFLKIYKHVQDQFNGITKKHLNYYFETLLGQSKKVNEPERTQVFFNLAKEAKSSVIPKNTLLLGGMEDDGDEILFETIENLNVSRAKIIDLITIHVANNSYVSPHNKAGLITGIYQNNINSVLNVNPNNTPLQLFGNDGFESTSSNSIVQSEVGWAVSGPIFLLKEGIRKITIDFHLEKESLSSFKEQINLLSKETTTQENVWISRFFNQTFHLSFTSDEGWFSVTSFLSTITETTSAYLLTFSFSLHADGPSISSFHEEIHEGSYQSSWPILRITLNNNNVYYPYSFLRDAKVNSIHTEVEVQELQNLDVNDQFGQLDTSRPFPIFGVQPGKAAACYVGYDEWRYKTLKSVDFTIKWHQIEDTKFRDIYKQYPEKVNTDSFKFQVSSLSNKEWKSPTESLSNLSLFEQKDTVIHETTSIHIDEPTILKMVPDFERKEYSEFSKAKNGYFKLQITTPSFGFGHSIYESLVNKTVQEITKNPKKARKKNIQIPQIPFVPQAKQIKASYVAEQDFILHSEEGRRTDKRFPFEFYHIHPFGLLPKATQEYTKDRSLLPYFEERGYLYLGLKDIHPLENTSFYFKIETQKSGNINSELTEVRWEYLQGEYWKEVPSTFLLYDGTHNFQHSGFLRIQMPKHLEHQHPLLEKGIAWLRLSVPNTTSTQLGKVVCVQLNGVEATRIIGKNSDSQTTLKEANAITSSYTSIPEIQSIQQPFIPTGGVVTEKQEDFYTRVSERLSHKKRGITPSDFEALILDTFSNVYQASCFPSTMFPQEVPPGTIKVMVLPMIYEDTPVGDRKFSDYTLLKIKKHLSKISTRSKSLVISNPLYETIRVTCTVNFNDDYETGSALQTLITTINRFIAPWILQRNEAHKNTDSKNQILDPSSLLSHLLALPEIETIGGLSMVQLHQSEEDNTYVIRETSGVEEEGLKPTKPWSVFVPSDAHKITIINTPVNDITVPLSIGTMEIENDFILKKQKPS